MKDQKETLELYAEEIPAEVFSASVEVLPTHKLMGGSSAATFFCFSSVGSCASSGSSVSTFSGN